MQKFTSALTLKHATSTFLREYTVRTELLIMCQTAHLQYTRVVADLGQLMCRIGYQLLHTVTDARLSIARLFVLLIDHTSSLSPSLPPPPSHPP